MRNAIRVRRRAVGLCVYCERIAMLGRSMCRPHLIRQRVYANRRMVDGFGFGSCKRCSAPILGVIGAASGLCHPCAVGLFNLGRIAKGHHAFGSEVVGLLGMAEQHDDINDYLADTQPLAFCAEAIDDHRQRAPRTSAWTDDCAPERFAS